jgi:heme/copper-type cytochrome/quinol oxidase subunit 3
MSTSARDTEAGDGLRRTPLLDVAELPDLAFGVRDIMWWGTAGFVVIEGTTLALCVVVYLYLWKNFHTWPPAGTERPGLVAATVQLALMLGSLPFLRRLDGAAKALDLQRVRRLLVVASLLIVAMTVVRGFELAELHVRWNQNAYGSAQWLVVGTHATLLLVEMVEVLGITAIFWFAPVEWKHFSDVADVAFYWMFLVLAWVPIYVLNYLGPRYFM